jgi:hypothetical protein
MIRALFTAIAALALAIGTALWFDPGSDGRDGGGEEDPVTATAGPASAVDPAPAVRAEEGPAVARSGRSDAAGAPPEDDAGNGAVASPVRDDTEASAPEASPTIETVELGRPDFGPEPVPAVEVPDGSGRGTAAVDPDRSAALIRRMLALYEVVRQ